LGQLVPFREGRIAAAFIVSAAVKPDHDGKFFAGSLGRRPNVQEQAVFADARRIWHVGCAVNREAVWCCGLVASLAPRGRIAHAFPWLGWLRLLPAQLAYRSCCKRNALENGNARFLAGGAL